MDDGKVNVMSIGMLEALHAAFDEAERNKTVPSYFSRTVMTGEMFAPPEAVTAGFFDRMVPAAELDAAADQAAEALSRINLSAHAATKLRARGPTIQAMRAAIDTDITPEYAEERVASRTAHT